MRKNNTASRPHLIWRLMRQICLFGFLASAIFFRPMLAQQSTFVSAVLQDAGGDLDKLSKIIDQHKALLDKYPHGEFAATVMFQLAELHAQKSNLLFQQQMAAYEKELEKFDRGELTTEPVMPRISFAETIDYSYKLLNDQPKIAFKDKVLYTLAMAYLQEGNRLKAKSYFDDIIQNFPQSSINLESHFRLGEYYFDRREYPEAIEHYRFLLGKWDNPYFDMALYKLGWSYYNLSDYGNAISTFVYLIEDVSMMEQTASRVMGKSKADLRSESIQYIASCFTEFGGPHAAREFLEPRKDKDYALPILLKMGETYQKRNYYPEAIETYQSLLSIYPFLEQAPSIYQQIVQNYELDGNFDAANKAREQIIEKFGPGGPWLAQYTEGELYKSANKLARESLIYLGTYYQSEAQKNNRARDYLLAVDKYQQYLQKFPKSEDAARVNYLMAESYYGSGDYSNAAKAYNDVVIKHDSSRYREEAAYNRILCYYQLTGIDQPMDSVTIYVDEFLGTSEILTVRVGRQSEIDLLRACNDFVRMFGSSKWLDQVLMKYGETLHELQAYFPAVKVYKKVAELGVDKPYHLTAMMNAGQCYFDGGYFEQSDLWFSTLVKNFPDSTKYLEKAKKLAISSKFKIADNYNNEGKSAEAASLLSVIARQSDDPQFQERALFGAGLQYQKTGDMQQAALTFEQLGKNIASSQLADEALYKAAGIRENNQEWSLAASDYLLLLDHSPKSQFAMRSMKSAATCYENLQDWFSAKRIYERFVATYPDADNETLECQFKCAELSYKTGKHQVALDEYKRTVSSYQAMTAKGKEVDSYFAAHAQFMVGEIMFAEYKQLNLTPPLETNLKRKVAKFQQVFAAYKNALEFQIADWSTAASFRIGMAFEEFVRAFMESPLPRGLKEDELKLYSEKLAEAAKPYKERALETYKRNVEQAEANNIENSWIAESRKRMQALIIELELSATPKPDGTLENKTAQAGSKS
jgi:TolA-binding protein